MKSLNRRERNDPPGAARPDASLKLEQTLIYQLTIISNWLGLSALRLYGNRFGLRSVTEWPILAALGEDAPLTAKAICDFTKFEKTRVARATKRLIACGYIVSQSDPSDGRRTLLWLTDTGAHLHDLLVPFAMERNETLSATLSHEERAQLRRIVAKLVAQLPEVERVGN